MKQFAHLTKYYRHKLSNLYSNKLTSTLLTLGLTTDWMRELILSKCQKDTPVYNYNEYSLIKKSGNRFLYRIHFRGRNQQNPTTTLRPVFSSVFAVLNKNEKRFK